MGGLREGSALESTVALHEVLFQRLPCAAEGSDGRDCRSRPQVLAGPTLSSVCPCLFPLLCSESARPHRVPRPSTAGPLSLHPSSSLSFGSKRIQCLEKL